MSPDQIRLECLRLALPKDLANPDATVVIARAKAFETYVMGEGQAKSPPQNTQPVASHQDRTKPQLQHPARK